MYSVNFTYNYNNLILYNFDKISAVTKLQVFFVRKVREIFESYNFNNLDRKVTLLSFIFKNYHSMFVQKKLLLLINDNYCY